MNTRVLRMVVCLFLVVVICMVPVRSGRAQETACDKCFSNTVTPTGHGGQDANGRPILNIRIDNSFGNDTPSNIWNGINGCKTDGCTGPGRNAVDNWNGQTGSPYAFQVSQSGQTIDITVHLMDDSYQGCGRTLWLGPNSQGTAVVQLPKAALNWTSDQVACIVSHEIGHVLGLAEVFPGCAQSIMNGGHSVTDPCACTTPDIQPKDVNLVNVKRNSATAGPGVPKCTVEADARTVAPFGGGGPGSCPPGDPSCCDPVVDPACQCDPATDPSCGDPCTDPSDTSCGTGCVVEQCPTGYEFDQDPEVCDCEPVGTGCAYVEGQCDLTYQWWDDVACHCVDFQPPPDPWDDCTLDWDFCY